MTNQRAAALNPDGTCTQCGVTHLDRNGKPGCAAHSKRTGKACRASRVPGAKVCRTHGGAAGHVQAAAKRRVALGEGIAELERLGRPLDVDPADAMLAMVHEAAGNVAVLRGLVQQLETKFGAGGIADYSGNEKVFNEAAPHVWVTMYDAEREKLVRWSKLCRDAGVDERRVQIAEAQAHILATAMRDATTDVLAACAAAIGDAWTTAANKAVLEQLPGILRRRLSEAAGRELNAGEQAA